MESISEGCPICNGDVKGDEESMYYCKSCNMLYTRKNLEMKPFKDEK